jgi:hypothetical protein
MAASATPQTPSLTQPPSLTRPPSDDGSQSLTLTEGDIYDLIDQAGGEAPVSVNHVEITPGGVALAGYADLSGIAGNFELYGVPYVESGYLRIRITSLSLNGAAIPAIFFPTIEEQINLLFGQAFGEYWIEEVILGEGELTFVVSLR